MTTVTTGNTVSFQIGPFDTLLLSSGGARGTLALTSAAPKLVADQTLGLQSGTFGPWGAPMSVVLTVTQGAIDYTVNAQSLTASQVVATQALVSGAGILWANRISAATAGNGAFQWFSDIGVNGALMKSDGTIWRLVYATDLLIDITPLTGAAGTVTSEQLQKQWTAPAGFLQCLRWLRISRLDYKTATSDTYTIRTRCGAGATPLTDALIMTASGIITTTQRSAASGAVYVFPSVTQARVLGNQNTLMEWGNGSGANATYPQNFTIPDISAATVFSCTMQLTTGTDSSASGQAHLLIQGG